MEIWKDIPGFEGFYQVSNNGRVKSLEREFVRSDGRNLPIKEKILKPSISNKGYLYLDLFKHSKNRKMVHQLVAIAFLSHKPNGYTLVVNHKDFNPSNNNVDNLEIITQRENANRKHIKSSSEFVGVHWNKERKRWHSRIQINGKIKHLGCYKNEHIAGVRYQLELAKIN